MASAGTPPDQTPRPGHPPGPLALLAATAVGGVIATRLGRTPLMLAAGAAALALLQHKKKAAPPQETAPHQPPRPAPGPEPEPHPRSQVEEWLSRQMLREQQEPVLDLSTATGPAETGASGGLAPAWESSFSPSQEAAPSLEHTPEPEDDYHPQAFLLDEAEEAPDAAMPYSGALAHLTEPAPKNLPPPAPPPPPPPPQENIPPPPLRELEPPGFSSRASSAWALGLEPLPSLVESEPRFDSASSLFFTAPPPPQEEVMMEPPPPAMMPPVFEGAALPDEINVAPASEPPETAAVAAPMLEAEPPPLQPAPDDAAAEVVREIEVQLAALGEASFDPPLATTMPDAWLAAFEIPAESGAAPAPAPAPAQPAGPVVEAEVILRPRAPVQPAGVHWTPAVTPRFVRIQADESPAPAVTDKTVDSPFPSPLQTPRRPSWLSWWQGD